MRKIGFLVAVLSVCLVSTSFAHDGSLGTEGDPYLMGDLTLQEEVHIDADPWKGTFTLIVQNTSDTAWTDFHFGLFTAPSEDDASSVYFDDLVLSMVGYTDPTHTIDSYYIDPVGGDTLDLYFDSNPVLPGEMVGFTVYTDNTTDNVNFGICFYPTVPEPATMAMLGLGALLLRRKK